MFPITAIDLATRNEVQGSAQPGYAINQIINRSVAPNVLLDTMRNPGVVLQQAGERYLYLTDEAAVVTAAMAKL